MNKMLSIAIVIGLSGCISMSPPTTPVRLKTVVEEQQETINDLKNQVDYLIWENNQLKKKIKSCQGTWVDWDKVKDLETP